MILRYFKYLFASKTRYKVHSPFVFDLINKVLKKKSDLSYLKSYTSELSKDNSIIEVCDHGAGSRKKGSKKRRINEIYKKSSSSSKKADLIRRICEYEKEQFICLELGTNLGVSTFAISSSPKCKKMVSIEGCPNIFHFSENKLKNASNIELINSTFDEKISYLLDQYQPNVVYIDGNHTYEATKKYFDIIAKFQCIDLIIFDDINWSKGMLLAWEEIINEERFKVSINLFRIGLLYRREGQKKEKFILRY